jgi:hypothetical protein
VPGSYSFRGNSKSRREFLQSTLALGAIASLSGELHAGISSEPPETDERGHLLDEIERRACLYFFDHADPTTGLVRDRARMQGAESRQVSSIAATGFGLSALCISYQRGYSTHSDALRRAQRALEYVARFTTQTHGFYPHFLDMRTGQRIWNSEFSSIDTTWLLCGVLHCRAVFENRVIRQLADEVYHRVNWRWMLDGGTTLSHGWVPERGFLPSRWDQYSELLAMYLLAIGSPEFAIPASSWDAWQRPIGTYDGISYIDPAAPLFVHQYSHAWFDFRGKRDRYADYFENSRLATEAHRLFCMGLSDRFPWYGRNMWGVTASDSRRGYSAWGDAGSASRLDGTLVPCAAGGSMAFLPDECGLVLDNMIEHYGTNVWGRYGFVDAFHPGQAWYDPDVIGIDQGITLLMAENARTGSVWKAMASAHEPAKAMHAVGLHG